MRHGITAQCRFATFVSVPSQPSTPTLAPASFRIRSRNIQLVPSGSQRRFEKRYLHFRVHAVARWLLFWSPPAARGAVGQNRSGFAFSAFTIIGFHLPSITSAVALTGHSESFIRSDLPSYKKVRTGRSTDVCDKRACIDWSGHRWRRRCPGVRPKVFGPTSVQFKGEINDVFPRKRHQKRHLEFCIA